MTPGALTDERISKDHCLFPREQIRQRSTTLTQRRQRLHENPRNQENVSGGTEITNSQQKYRPKHTVHLRNVMCCILISLTAGVCKFTGSSTVDGKPSPPDTFSAPFNFQVTFQPPLTTDPVGGVRVPHKRLTRNKPDFGGLVFRVLEHDGETRQITETRLLHKYDPAVTTHSYIASQLHQYAFDDDMYLSSYTNWDEEDIPHPGAHCRRPAWHRQNHPICNSFHELDRVDAFNENRLHHIGGGGYRTAYRANLGNDNVVFKTMLLSSTHGAKPGSYGEKDFEYMRIDALVPDIFTSSPYFVDIYGYCGVSHFSELMVHGTVGRWIQFNRYERTLDQYTKEELDDLANALKPAGKLEIALQMAEALAHMTNYGLGSMVHSDLWISQYLLNVAWEKELPIDGRIVVKLNDFNRAFFQLFDEELGDYCAIDRGCGVGEWHPPEFFKCDYINEKMDVWSLGLNIYSIVTGLDIHPQVPTEEMAADLIVQGAKSYIQDGIRERNFIEGSLLDVMDDCLTYESTDRPDIGQVVLKLRSIKNKARAMGLLQDHANPTHI